ncbi:MAG: hypothetical protein K2L14_10065 [Duncaniella sp.]|nr:hypothetical protein [Duncaniella sp.]
MEVCIFLMCHLLSIVSTSNQETKIYTILDSLSTENQLISQLCKYIESGNLSYDFFKLNEECDTIIILTQNPSRGISIWSKTDSISLYYRSDSFISLERRAELLGINPGRLLLPFYEKELLYNWDIDSIKILCFFDDNVYEVWPSNEAYRIITDEKTISIKRASYGPHPAMPTEYLDSNEIQQRLLKKKELFQYNQRMYENLFNRQHQENLPSKQNDNFDSIFICQPFDILATKH